MKTKNLMSFFTMTVSCFICAVFFMEFYRDHPHFFSDPFKMVHMMTSVLRVTSVFT